MSLGNFQAPTPVNEPILDYRPGSPERSVLQAELARQAGDVREIVPRIAGNPVTRDPGRSGRPQSRIRDIVMPHDHHHTLARVHTAGPDEVDRAVRAATAARHDWGALPWEQRAAVFLRAAALLRGPYRARLNAATMLGQSKTVHQAEIDAAAELIDFFTFNAHYLDQLQRQQPYSPSGTWNRIELRPLDGFVFAVSPFNFTSIAGNLPTAPALCGNTVLWKPATTAALAADLIMDLLEEAGLPPGVISFLPGDGADVGDPTLAQPEFAGLHFTGGTATFRTLWRTIAGHIDQYRQYPRIVGETGGKDFVVAHPSADPDALRTALVRGAFEYQGQKCSAASRAYIPRSLWPALRQGLAAAIDEIGVGDITDFRNFMGAVITQQSFDRLSGAIADARTQIGGPVTEILGGVTSDDGGWFIGPTVIVTTDPAFPNMTTELFGPILSVYVYDDRPTTAVGPTSAVGNDAADAGRAFRDVLTLCDRTSPYALTGAIFARDRLAIETAVETLRFAAGNFYINDKPTGAVVGQQPFGGGRASGTNDKAGSPINLQRWLSARTIKETFAPSAQFTYPSMAGN